MAWTFPVNPGDVLEMAIFWNCLDQTIELKTDLLIGGTGTSTSDDVFTTFDTNYTASLILDHISTLTLHNQSRLQQITDCVIGSAPALRPRRVRGLLDKLARVSTLDGADAQPAIPTDKTVSVQLVTNGAPRQFWGRKSFGQVTTDAISADGEKLPAIYRAAWDTAASLFFTGAHPLGGVATLTYTCGILPTTYIANLPGPHAAMSTYFYPVLGTQVGFYVGSQRSRKITPQSTQGH